MIKSLINASKSLADGDQHVGIIGLVGTVLLEVHFLHVLVIHLQTGPLVSHRQDQIGGQVLHTRKQIEHVHPQTLLQKHPEQGVVSALLQEKNRSPWKLTYDLLLIELATLLS